MTGRATPFGLFAGCSIGTVGAATRLVLTDRSQYRRHTRLDMDYLVLLTDALAREPGLQPALTFGVNTSLYPVRGRFRYCEVRRNGTGWTHHQVALEATDYLTRTLARARAGGGPAALAAGLVAADPDATEEEAAEYVGELITNQVLVSELRPAVTGPEPLPGLAARLRERGATEASRGLEEVRGELEALDAGGVGAAPARYRHIAGLLKTLPGEINLGRLFQVDMVKPVVTARLGTAVLHEIARGVTCLHRLARRPRDEALSRFREAFVTRYDGREVPLVEALDEDSGIGFDTLKGTTTDACSLLDGLTFPNPEEGGSVTWGRREAWLLRHLGSADVMELTPPDLDELAESNPLPLPEAFAVMATVAAASEKALDAGDFQVVLGGVSGPSGARLLGRFCHADPQVQQAVLQHIRSEEALDPDAVFAEIIHLPEGRLGNILARPILREYEVPFLGSAGAPADRQILITDLVVSVDRGRVILRSARLGRRVIPRLTSAHNYHASRGIYRFLCALQSEGTAAELAWDWGPLREAPFLPRVTSGRLVLSRATWRVNRDELKSLGQIAGAARFRAVQEWRTRRRLPRWITVAEGDNELPVDLDNVLATETLVELIKARAEATLIELFPGPDRLCARGPEGRFVHELIVPFVRAAPLPSPQGARAARAVEHRGPAGLLSSPTRRTDKLARSFPPGSEWLYVKLYTGPAGVDQVLRDVVRPVVEEVRRSCAADGWFFIRYGDPDWHLRLRFHGHPEQLRDEVWPALQAAADPLLANGLAWRLQLDTYEREVERYGGPDGIELAERLFQADSDAALALAGLLTEDARGDLRWRLALLGMDLLLADFRLGPEARRAIVRKARDLLAEEFRADAALRRQLGTRFRQERRSLDRLLARVPDADARVAAGREALRRRSHAVAPVVREFEARAAAGRLTRPFTVLVPSYLHMHANRLLRSAHRVQELVLYDFLSRLYDSQCECPDAARDTTAPREVPTK
jgi:thiopeptide-type bacteriocin biosynthesis protein